MKDSAEGNSNSVAPISKPSLRRLSIVLTVFCLLAPPLLGVHLQGQPLTPYLAFPPLTRHVAHAAFSWSVFIPLAAFVVAVLWFLVWSIYSAGRGAGGKARSRGGRFPLWAWVGVGLVCVFWPLAWTRFEAFGPLQRHTFTPLWIGYILIVNGLAERSTGSSLLTRHPRQFLLLFPLSAAFWWFFEYLNRFVQNWYYFGVEDFSPVEYALHATAAFSTVLPAVLSTVDWFAGNGRLGRAFTGRRPLKSRGGRKVGGALLLMAVLIGVGLGIWPNLLFPFVWIAPLLVILGVQGLLGLPTLFAPLREGDWRPVFIPALAGLWCGFFWELWNVGSLAHWEYAVPYVDRFHLFEMPILGYAGYLPFGLECLAVAGLFQGSAAVTLRQPAGIGDRRGRDADRQAGEGRESDA